MSDMRFASRAYQAAAESQSTRQREADIFRQTIGRLQASRAAGPIARVRALADNRRLWMTIADLMRDVDNNLPAETRAGILSVGIAVQREMDRDEPDFDFLITINRQIAEGLSATS